MWSHSLSGNTDPFARLASLAAGNSVSGFEAGFAYASMRGALQLRTALEKQPSLANCSKQIFVGIHHGISEPGAINLLREITNTTVKLFCPTNSITEKSLTSKPVYHPKYCLMKCGNGDDHWLVGSANLTSSAIGVSGNNIELGLIETKRGPEKIAYRKMLEKWRKGFDSYFHNANPSTITKYANARLDFLSKHPIILDEVEPPVDISSATRFFIDVGAGSGMDRHQVEFSLPLVSFFAVHPKQRIDLTLMRGNRVWDNRPLTPKTTTFGVEIFRLGMPTVRTEGEIISNRAIQFTRTADPTRFKFEVDDIGGPRYVKWLAECNKHGHIGNTSGGRRFGYVF